MAIKVHQGDLPEGLDFGKMVAKGGEKFVGVPLEEVVSKKRVVELDHPLITAARAVEGRFAALGRAVRPGLFFLLAPRGLGFAVAFHGAEQPHGRNDGKTDDDQNPA